MAGKQAKILSTSDIDLLLRFAATTRYATRNRVIVMLSAKAGLRAGEIAALTWDMVVDTLGQVSTVIELRDYAAKKGSGRRIPLHRDLRAALTDLHRCSATPHVVVSERGGPLTALSVVIWFNRAYAAVGLSGCSSPGAAPLSRAPRGWFTRPAVRCVTCNC